MSLLQKQFTAILNVTCYYQTYKHFDSAFTKLNQINIKAFSPHKKISGYIFVCNVRSYTNLINHFFSPYVYSFLGSARPKQDHVESVSACRQTES